MREGQQIIVLGSVNVYERTGSYQLYAQEIRLDGEGTLYENYQMLKQELEEMGMFAPEYKKQFRDMQADRRSDCTDRSGSPGYHEYICKDVIRMYSYFCIRHRYRERERKNQSCVESVCWRQKM